MGLDTDLEQILMTKSCAQNGQQSNRFHFTTFESRANLQIDLKLSKNPYKKFYGAFWYAQFQWH